MKFLLTAINAKYIHSNPAIYSLRAHAGQEMQKHIELAEYTINQSFSDILADIYKRRPDAVGFSCYIWNISLVLELVEELGKILPGIPIWLGGPEVSFDAPKLLEMYPQLTGVMIGEGEETFKELLTAYLEMPQELSNIPGLCLPDGYTPPREPADLSSLPFLYNNLDAFENKIIYYESSRGCPFRCSYCLSSIDKKVRLRNLELVKKELQFFLDHQVKQVKFVDRTFNCNHAHAMEIWKYLVEHDNGVTNFHFEISADILNEKEIKLLNGMRPGLVQLEIGVQSTNPETIQAINRTMNVDKLEKIVRSINAGHNVHQHLDLIAGLPYEDYKTFAESFNRVYAMEPEQLQLGFLKVLKGSRMAEMAEKYGLCYQSKSPYEVLYTRWLSYEDVLRLKGIEEMVEMYYNSNQFRYTLAFLVKQFETPFQMFEALAAFYERKGYFTNSPARAYRYQVLLEFALEWCRANGNGASAIAGGGAVLEETWGGSKSEYAEIFRELLTYDMYLRENLKSRPEFAADLTPYKEQCRRFYMQEEKERKYLPGYEAYDHKQMAKMTHMEVFKYPVWDKVLWRQIKELASCPESHCEVFFDIPQYVLFDYQERNPLTGDARTVLLGEHGTGVGKSQEVLDLEI